MVNTTDAIEVLDSGLPGFRYMLWGAYLHANVCIRDKYLFSSLVDALLNAYSTVERWDLLVKRVLILRIGNRIKIRAEPEGLRRLDKEYQDVLGGGGTVAGEVFCGTCYECGNGLSVHQPNCTVGHVAEIMHD
jgi:hypothetical protein